MIVWLDNSHLQDERIQQLIIDNKIIPLVTDIGISDHLNDYVNKTGKNYYEAGFCPYPKPGNVSYIDEPLTMRKTFKVVDNLVVGESSIEFIDKLIKSKVKNITYTAYRQHLKRVNVLGLFQFNVRNIFRNQLPTWERMHILYGNLFNYCWINMLLNQKDYKELIQWCKHYNKTICITYEFGKQDCDSVYQTLKEFIEAYNECY